MNAKSWIVGIAMLAASIATASAQILKDQLIGVWTLVSNIEKYQDGKEKSTFGPPRERAPDLRPNGLVFLSAYWWRPCKAN
jgi:hypothetical protein